MSEIQDERPVASDAAAGYVANDEPITKEHLDQLAAVPGLVGVLFGERRYQEVLAVGHAMAEQDMQFRMSKNGPVLVYKGLRIAAT